MDGGDQIADLPRAELDEPLSDELLALHLAEPEPLPPIEPESIERDLGDHRGIDEEPEPAPARAGLPEGSPSTPASDTATDTPVLDDGAGSAAFFPPAPNEDDPAGREVWTAGLAASLFGTDVGGSDENEDLPSPSDPRLPDEFLEPVHLDRTELGEPPRPSADDVTSDLPPVLPPAWTETAVAPASRRTDRDTVLEGRRFPGVGRGRKDVRVAAAGGIASLLLALVWAVQPNADRPRRVETGLPRTTLTTLPRPVPSPLAPLSPAVDALGELPPGAPGPETDPGQPGATGVPRAGGEGPFSPPGTGSGFGPAASGAATDPTRSPSGPAPSGGAQAPRTGTAPSGGGGPAPQPASSPPPAPAASNPLPPEPEPTRRERRVATTSPPVSEAPPRPPAPEPVWTEPESPPGSSPVTTTSRDTTASAPDRPASTPNRPCLQGTPPRPSPC